MSIHTHHEEPRPSPSRDAGSLIDQLIREAYEEAKNQDVETAQEVFADLLRDNAAAIQEVLTDGSHDAAFQAFADKISRKKLLELYRADRTAARKAAEEQGDRADDEAAEAAAPKPNGDAAHDTAASASPAEQPSSAAEPTDEPTDAPQPEPVEEPPQPQGFTEFSKFLTRIESLRIETPRKGKLIFLVDATIAEIEWHIAHATRKLDRFERTTRRRLAEEQRIVDAFKGKIGAKDPIRIVGIEAIARAMRPAEDQAAA